METYQHNADSAQKENAPHHAARNTDSRAAREGLGKNGPQNNATHLIAAVDDWQHHTPPAVVDADSVAAAVRKRAVDYGTALLELQREASRFDGRRKTVEDVLAAVRRMEASLGEAVAADSSAAAAAQQRARGGCRELMAAMCGDVTARINAAVADRLTAQTHRLALMQAQVAAVRSAHEGTMTRATEQLRQQLQQQHALREAHEQLLAATARADELERQLEEERQARRAEQEDARRAQLAWQREREQQEQQERRKRPPSPPQQQQVQSPRQGLLRKAPAEGHGSGAAAGEEMGSLLGLLRTLAAAQERFKTQQMESNARYGQLAAEHEQLKGAHAAALLRLRRGRQGSAAAAAAAAVAAVEEDQPQVPPQRIMRPQQQQNLHQQSLHQQNLHQQTLHQQNQHTQQRQWQQSQHPHQQQRQQQQQQPRRQPQRP
jgi:hypothetical protein